MTGTTFADLQQEIGPNIGIALMPISSTAASPTLLGSWDTGPAWSTIKVPIAQAALNAGTANPTWVHQAITASDNTAAANLWSSLGATSTAGAQVQQVLRDSGDPSTVVQTQAVRPEFSSFGQTNWSLADQTRFLSHYSQDPHAAPVLQQMGQISPDQQWGLGRIPNSKFKGGWGPTEDGKYLVRQMGIIDTPQGPVAVAMAAEGDDFEAGQGSADKLAAWVKDNAGKIAYGKPGAGKPGGDGQPGPAGSAGDPVVRVDKDGVHTNYGGTQGALSEQSAAIPAPDGSGLDDPQITDALHGRVEKARNHLADAEETLRVGKNAATSMDDTAHDGANKVSQASTPGGPTSVSPAATMSGAPMGAPAAAGPANPFASRFVPAGVPQMSAPAPLSMPALPSFGVPNVGMPAASSPSPSRLAKLSGPTGQIANIPAPGNLTADCTPLEAFAAVIAEARRRGYSLDRALACGSTMLQESGGDARAVSSNGLWRGLFQQNANYPDPMNPNTAIKSFFDKLDAMGGRTSPDIWKTIFRLQQAPSFATDEAAFNHPNSRQEYLTEIQGKHDKAVQMYQQLAASASSVAL
ncbi:hypothetical protein [Mycolicibacterium fortuitum]|uniref:hypothetical protein n=1 Tax=Mycolicibacterium fortuitum TaxID=1766 RepID=UPI00260DEA79|nr:hypothetical protein [Mycolicibacterium fortuitum]